MSNEALAVISLRYGCQNLIIDISKYITKAAKDLCKRSIEIQRFRPIKCSTAT